MNRAGPAVDFNGVVLVNSLEIGAVIVGSQRVPAVRFVLKQSKQRYSLLATGRQSAEVYAYAQVAHNKGWSGLEAHVVAIPRPVERSVILVVATADDGESGITWHTGSELRAAAVQILVDVLNGVATFPREVIETPFAHLNVDE
jgi:hypothetical protein